MPSARDQKAAVPEKENVIEVQDLEFSYGRNKAVDKLSFSLARGEILGFIGKNGAGKTTTIHLLLGFLRYRKGSIRVLGFDPKHDNINILERCGFFPEQGEPYEWMRVRNLFRMGRYTYGNWDRLLCEELSEQLELDTSKRISDLSRGMLVKAKLIFALSHRPEILILDEPTNVLDPVSRYDILNLVRSLSIQQGVAVLISSHNLDEVAEVATHVCIINHGRNIFSNSMGTIKSDLGLLEVPSEIRIPQRFHDQAIMSRNNGGKVQILVVDGTDPTMIDFVKRSGDGKVKLRNLNLKELFILVTRDT